MTAITEPGVYELPDDVYHADPVLGGSLSHSGAKTLLRAPALFVYERKHGRPLKRQYEVGHAAHKEVLGVGPELVLVDRERWDTKAVKEELKAIRDAGKVPVKRNELRQVRAMAAAIREHPIAGPLFDPQRGGKPEQSLFWGGGDIMLRARLDWLPAAGRGRLVIPDYKTCDCASLAAIRRAAASYSYHMQDAWYRSAVDNVLGAEPAFVFVFQEKTPPYLVTVVQFDDEAVAAGHRAMSRAIEIYRDCSETGVWPAYVGDAEIPEISLPPWVTRDEEF